MEKLKEGSVWSYSEEGNDGKYYTFISRNGSKTKFAKKIQVCDSSFVSGYTPEKWIKERISQSSNELSLRLIKLYFDADFICYRQDKAFSESEIVILNKNS